MVAQFIAAFDDIVIGRFNKEREEKDRINVRYLYAPKQRVMHDIINLNKTIEIPAVAVNISSVSRDTTRVFNKVDGFYYSSNDPQTNQLTSRHIKAPIPINLELSVSIIARYQSDIDQILSNFVPFCNPYVVISWYVPKEFNIAVDQEIRSEVLWNGNVAMNYPIELNGSAKARVTADTSFTVKGWLFKDEAQPAGNIFFIENNFITENVLTEYESMTGFNALSSIEYNYDTSSSKTRTDTFILSGSPFVSGIYYNNVLLQAPLKNIETTEGGKITLKGTSLQYTNGILLSCTSLSALSSLKVYGGFSKQPGISGQLLDFEILNDNAVTFDMPPIPETAGRVSFVPFNTAGWDTSYNSYLSATAPDGLDARGIKPIFFSLINGFYLEVESDGTILSLLPGDNAPVYFEMT